MEKLLLQLGSSHISSIQSAKLKPKKLKNLASYPTYRKNLMIVGKKPTCKAARNDSTLKTFTIDLKDAILEKVYNFKNPFLNFS